LRPECRLGPSMNLNDKISVFRFFTESVMKGGSSLIFSEMPAMCFMAWITMLDAACMRGELLSVVIVPSFSSMAAPGSGNIVEYVE